MKRFQSVDARGSGQESRRTASSLAERFASSPATWTLFVSLAALGALSFGILGIGRNDNFAGQFDTQYFYAAGNCLWRGLSPYLPSNFALCSEGMAGLHQSGYLYPPPFAAFAMALSSFPILAAKGTVTGINFIAIVYLSYYCIQNSYLTAIEIQSSNLHWVIPVIILTNPFTAHVLWLGQTSLMVTAAIAAAWLYARKPNRFLIGGLFIGLSTIKPQFSVLPILWLILEHRWPALLVGALVAALLSLPGLISIGPVTSIVDWLSAIDHYRVLDVNQIDDPHVFGVQSLLSAMGFAAPSLFWIGVLGVVMLWLFRSHVEEWAILPIIATLAVLFGYSHDYDLVVLILVLPAFWIGLRGNTPGILFAAALLGLLCLPQRLVGLQPSFAPVSPADLGNSVVIRFRVFVVLGLWLWLLVLGVRKSSRK